MFGIGESTSKTTASSTGAADQAKVLTGKEANYLESGSLQVGKGGKLNLPGVVDLGGSKGSKIITGSDFTGTQGNVTVTSSDPTVTREAINALALLSTQFGTSLSDFASKSASASAASQAGTTAALASNAQTLTDAISNIGKGETAQAATDAASAATGGVSNFTKPALIIAVALLALIGFIFWTRK